MKHCGQTKATINVLEGKWKDCEESGEKWDT